jgi:predicted transcriptional regulator
LVEAGRSLTPSEVLEVLNASTTLSYSTVVTTLTRLYKKGSVARQRHGRAYKYGAMADAPGLIAGRMSRLLSEERDRASVLRRFVSALDPGDEELLRELLCDPET